VRQGGTATRPFTWPVVFIDKWESALQPRDVYGSATSLSSIRAWAGVKRAARAVPARHGVLLHTGTIRQVRALIDAMCHTIRPLSRHARSITNQAALADNCRRCRTPPPWADPLGGQGRGAHDGALPKAPDRLNYRAVAGR
jgi:hypothetical protein